MSRGLHGKGSREGPHLFRNLACGGAAIDILVVIPGIPGACVHCVLRTRNVPEGAQGVFPLGVGGFPDWTSRPEELHSTLEVCSATAVALKKGDGNETKE